VGKASSLRHERIRQNRARGVALLNMQGEVLGITSFGIVTGQNLNFVIPISYAKPLLTADQVKPLAHLEAAAPGDKAKQGIARLAGTYVGVWQSKLSGSGALALTVEVENGVMRASATITGSPSGYKGDSLTASNLKDMGDGVWSVDLTGEHSKLSATGIFKPGTFVGDFACWRTAWRRLTQEAGLSGLRFHDLRHHAITELAESSTSEQTIMSIAGHVSARMLAHYSHVRLNAKRDALAVLSDGSQTDGHVTSDVTNASPDAPYERQVVENMVDVTGIEPATPCLQSRCSPS
jgi:hypothetical protein